MRGWLLLMMATLGVNSLRAQDTVRVRGVYDPGTRAGLVVLPTVPALDSIRAIIARDLDYSDLFDVITLPAVGPVTEQVLATINYPLYRSLKAGLAVEIIGSSGNVTVRIHDLSTETVRHEMTQPLDASGIGEARMAVHRVSDDIVQVTTGKTGIAATRILFVNNADRRIYRIDSDGYGLAPMTPANVLAISPAWSPDGSRFAYTQLGGEGPGTLILQSTSTGTRVVVPTTTSGQNITPSFSADGRRLVFSRMTEQAANLYTVNVADLCCAERITAVRFAENLSPVYSPDGRRVAFVSNRAGSPQIYGMASDGTNQELLVPFDYGSGGSFAPDWSADGTTIVFHREFQGAPQLMTYHLGSRQLKQQTSSGRNEDPSFAPDGRHVVFISNRTGRGQLHVLDLETARVRQIMTPGVARLPSWSHSLGRGR
ncbi:MAG: PD40 domain-containing protein [Gemmatimonadales bacterium]|nr:PD40 domain-containing protein [Gemmatimonadales bacterium]